MSQVRSMIQVRGLDCPNEVASLRAALRDQEGITGLGFDLINGIMTVDHVAGVVDPAGLARLITERTGMPCERAGRSRGIRRDRTARVGLVVVAIWTLGADGRSRAWPWPWVSRSPGWDRRWD